MKKGNLRTSMKKPVIPDVWLEINKNAMLSAKEIYKAFGYSSVNALHGGLNGGAFPLPDSTSPKDSLHSNKVFENRWKVSTVLKEAKRRIALFDDAN